MIRFALYVALGCALIYGLGEYELSKNPSGYGPVSFYYASTGG